VLARASISPTAVLPSPPPTLPRWAKILWAIADTVATGVQWTFFDYGSTIHATQAADTDPEPTQWRKFQVVAENNVSVERADDQIFSFELVNYTNGQPDNTWTDADYTTVDNALELFLTTYRSAMVPYLTFTEMRAYIRQFNPYSNPKPFADSGPPEKVNVMNYPGLATQVGWPQSCTTITEKTPARKHWGRFYLPTLSPGTSTTSGHLTPAVADSIIAAWSTFLTTVMDAGFTPVVPTTQIDKVQARTLQGVTSVQIDDVTDVIRRRRYRSASYRHEIPVGTTVTQQPA
jgi:hypothetical protein